MKRAAWIASTIVIGTMVLAGCGSAAQTPTGTNSSSNTAQSTSSNQTESNQTSSNQTSSNQSTSTNNSAPSGSVNTAGGGNGSGTSNTTTTAAAAALVRESMALAKQGKAIDIPFTLQQNMGTVQNLWGNTNSLNAAGAGIYMTYSSHAAAFGLNKGSQIFDIRSYNSKLKAITLSDIESVLGQPADTRHTPDSMIYMYPAGANYQLLFVFPWSSNGSMGNTVDHVSVFWPQGTVDLMAQNQPNPSIVIDNAPGTAGSLFTFTIQNSPKGYRLVELEWIPNHGSPVVMTVQQAIANGATGETNPGFGISGDGTTYSFTYPSSMRDQTGIVRLIYQETSGGAIIGNSSSITLK